MIWLTLAALALAAFTVGTCFQHVRNSDRRQDRERQSWANERRELNDRLAHAIGNPWTPAPLRPVPDSDLDEPRFDFADVENEPV